MIPPERIATMIAAGDYDLAFRMIRENLETEGPVACLELWQRLRAMGAYSPENHLYREMENDAYDNNSAILNFVRLPFLVWQDEKIDKETTHLVAAEIMLYTLRRGQEPSAGTTLEALRTDIRNKPEKWEMLSDYFTNVCGKEMDESTGFAGVPDLILQVRDWIYEEEIESTSAQPPG
ncbi:MAG: hypothetical protein NTW79_00555 [Candidatus Berkelbacteria bacterium]|nr:hypothetical protein [Candidatus Berkelbacteria bacterium]